MAARNDRRRGFAWILRQLCASEQLLDRLAAGDIVAVLMELKARAKSGDPTAINVLGEIAYQQCYLGRTDDVLEGYQASQLTSAQALPSMDRESYSTALREDIAFDKQMKAACSQVIDQDQVQSWVEARAAQGDGASLWLLVNLTNHMAERQQRLRDAAAAGFPEAQFELAWTIIAGQQGAAGTGTDMFNAGDLLRQSADQLPRSEGELAVCELSGCYGISADIDAAVTHARDAAQRGFVDAVIAIGPHLSPSQMDPDEVSAWTLVQASLNQQGCAGNGISVRWMKSATDTPGSTTITSNARTLADQFWQQYGAQMRELKQIGKQMTQAPDGQVSLTDPDARSMATSGRGTGIVGYNVQTAVDTKHHMIVAHEVTNVGHDRDQLSPMAQKTCAAIDEKDLTVFADRGYYKGEQILECEQAGIKTLVPKPQTSGNKAAGLFDKADFRYIPAKNEYRCPAGERAIWRYTRVEDGLTLHKYWSSACSRCTIKAKCTMGENRRIARWEHEDVLDKMQRRLNRTPQASRIRRQTAEHPFGTLKAWMGATHFLTKTIPRVSTEMSLHVLAYNMKRAMQILGIAPLMAAIRV